MKPLFGCSQDDEIALNLVPNFLASGRAENMLPLFARFKLMGAINKVKQELEKVDALLSCPWWFVELSTFSSLDDVSSEGKDAICHSLLFGINWIREVELYRSIHEVCWT